MGDETARLRIEADANDLAAAKDIVDRLTDELDAAHASVNRGAAGWKAQSGAVAELSRQLEKAERQYKQLRTAMAAGTPVDYGRVAVNLPADHPVVQRAAQRPSSRASAPTAGGMSDPRATSSIDTNRAGRMSMLGMSLAQTAQDAAYNPVYAVNNIMGMAQMSGGVKNLGKDLLDLGMSTAKTATRFSRMNLVLAVGAAGLVALDKNLKSSELGWGDLLTVLGNTKPVTTASAAISEFWDTLGESAAGQAVSGTWESVTGWISSAAGDLADYTLGWDAATAAAKKHNDEVAKAAKRAAEVEEAIKALGSVRSEDQQRGAEEGKALVQRLADMGGEGGLSSAATRIGSSVAPNGLTGNAAIEEVYRIAHKAQQGDEKAIGDLTGWAKQAGMDPGEIVTDREKREKARQSGQIVQEIDRDLGEVDRVMGDKSVPMSDKFDALNAAIERINGTISAGLLTDEDYARVIERTNALKREAAQAEESLAKAREAAQNKAEEQLLDEEQRKNMSVYDRRVGRFSEMYGGAFGNDIIRAQQAAAARGEDQTQVDDRMREQLMARMRFVPEQYRQGVASSIVERARMNTEDYAMQRGAMADITGARLGEMAANGQERTYAGQMLRQRAIAAGRGMGIDVNAYAKGINEAKPGEFVLKSAEKIDKAGEAIQRAAEIFGRSVEIVL